MYLLGTNVVFELRKPRPLGKVFGQRRDRGCALRDVSHSDKG